MATAISIGSVSSTRRTVTIGSISGTVTYPLDANGDAIVYGVYGSCGGSGTVLIGTFTVNGATEGTYSFNVGSYTFTGLSANTTYYPTVALYNYSTGSNLSTTAYTTVTTSSEWVSMTVNKPTSTSAETTAVVNISCGIAADVTYVVGYGDPSKGIWQYSGSFSSTSDTTKTLSTTTLSGMSAGTTYSLYAYLYENGAASPLVTYGPISYTTDAAAIARPSDWNWTSTISSGSTMSYSGTYPNITVAPVTASEWNSFCSRVNAFRNYCGLSNWSFTTVAKGNAITAAVLQEPIYAMATLRSTYGAGALPAAPSSGGAATADFFITLRDSLNAIP